MKRVLWPLLHDRPHVEVVLTRAADGQPHVHQLLADTGAGTAHSGFEIVLSSADCLMVGGKTVWPVVLRGAFAGTFPVYLIRVQIPAIGFDGGVPAAAAPNCPTGFDGIAGFRFLKRFTYGNFGDPDSFGLEL